MPQVVNEQCYSAIRHVLSFLGLRNPRCLRFILLYSILKVKIPSMTIMYRFVIERRKHESGIMVRKILDRARAICWIMVQYRTHCCTIQQTNVLLKYDRHKKKCTQVCVRTNLRCVTPNSVLISPNASNNSPASLPALLLLQTPSHLASKYRGGTVGSSERGMRGYHTYNIIQTPSNSVGSVFTKLYCRCKHVGVLGEHVVSLT